MSAIINHHISPPVRFLTTSIVPGGKYYDTVITQISYKEWIKSKGGIVDLSERWPDGWDLISIEFENEEGATAFKLKYM